MNITHVVSLSVVVITVSFTGCSKKVTKAELLNAKPAPQQIKPSAQEALLEQRELESKIKEIFIPIYFDYNTYSIAGSERIKLERIASFLKRYPNITVLLEGHCDERGSSEYNMGLGENRARAVVEWLKAYGISESRLDITSFGKERPAKGGCTTEDCYSKNRRDEWRIIVH